MHSRAMYVMGLLSTCTQQTKQRSKSECVSWIMAQIEASEEGAECCFIRVPDSVLQRAEPACSQKTEKVETSQ